MFELYTAIKLKKVKNRKEIKEKLRYEKKGTNYFIKVNMNTNATKKEIDVQGAAPDPGHLSCPPKKDGAKKGAPMKIPAAFSGGPCLPAGRLGTALKLAPQGKAHHHQNGASDSHRGLTLRPCRLPGIFKGDGIQTEVKQNGVVTANYVRTMNIDEPLMRIRSDGTIRHYKQDALGSVIALTDEAGVVKTTYAYDPFGAVTITGEASDNPFQFAGRENDGTGLLFERNRYYSWEQMRYISEDPIGFAGGDVNLFVRVKNNPVNFVDPLGLWYFDIGFNIPIHPVFGGVSLNIQITSDCIMMVPGLYIGTPGFSAMAITGKPTSGFQSSISGGYWIGGTLTSYGQHGPYSGGIGFVTPGIGAEVLQWGIPIKGCKPKNDECEK